MRLLVIAAACALAVAGSAAAQTKGYAPTTSQIGDSQVQTGHTASMPGPAARPATMAGSSVARPASMARPTARHSMARHHMRGHRHMGRHHRTHGASWCSRHTHGRKMSHRAMTHAIERCEAGRHHHRHHRHRMAHRTTTTRTTTVSK